MRSSKKGRQSAQSSVLITLNGEAKCLPIVEEITVRLKRPTVVSSPCKASRETWKFNGGFGVEVDDLKPTSGNAVINSASILEMGFIQALSRAIISCVEDGATSFNEVSTHLQQEVEEAFDDLTLNATERGAIKATLLAREKALANWAFRQVKSFAKRDFTDREVQMKVSDKVVADATLFTDLCLILSDGVKKKGGEGFIKALRRQ